jgi:serine/threonine protein kinase
VLYPRSGQKFYILWRPLGKGAFGEVFGAEIYDAKDQVVTPCAIKRVPAQAGAAEAAATSLYLFRRHADGTWAPPHPNLVHLENGFVIGDDCWIVLERCDGTLADFVGRAGFEAQRWFRSIARDVLRGVRQIHYVGGAHTDVHPENVLYVRIADRVTFKVSDLGLRERWVDAHGNAERPELLLDDVYWAGTLLTEVGQGHFFEGPAADHLHGLPRPVADALGHALNRGFRFTDGKAAVEFLNGVGDADPAAQFLAALERACDECDW